MARMTKDEHESLMKEIAEKTNASPEVLDLIDKIRKDFDESLVIDTSEWEEKLKTMQTERDTAIGERDEARRVYRERFFNGIDRDDVLEEVTDNEAAPKTIDEVLAYREER